MTTTIKKHDLELLLESIAEDGAADPEAEGQGLPAELPFSMMVDIALQNPDLMDTVITRHGDAADDEDVVAVKALLATSESRLGANNDVAMMLRSWIARHAVAKLIGAARRTVNRLHTA